MKQKIAIIGTGIAGMSAGYFLKDHFDVHFFEKNDYPGGHTNTKIVDEDGQPVYIDTGFIVFNKITYPNLLKFFEELNIPIKPSSMSFSVQYLPTSLEYCGTGLNGLFAQRRNLLNLRHWKMLLDMDRFNKESVKILDNKKYWDYTVLDYVKENNYSDDFLNKFLIPISSDVWSTSAELMQEFPIYTLVAFFKNHGFLGLDTHYQWYTVDGGSRVYRDRVLDFFQNKVYINRGISRIEENNNQVVVCDKSGQREVFYKVIVATHANETLHLFGKLTDLQRRLLGQFSYQKNKATLHTDESIMPKRKLAWSSWNYRIQEFREKLTATLIYDMNSLQQVSKKKNYFVSINDPGLVDSKKILWQTEYEHPIYNVAAIKAQRELYKLNETGPIYFCGSYFKYGFHEDAFVSGLEVARRIRGEDIWN